MKALNLYVNMYNLRGNIHVTQKVFQLPVAIKHFIMIGGEL